MRIKIRHPLATHISIVDHSMAMARQGLSSEVAFFWRGQWVNEPIEPFADYHDRSDGDTSVYGYVPNDLIDAFLAETRCE